MVESGYYPLGADTPNAPWNETELDPVEKEVEFSCTMMRTATVETNNYIPGTWEKDEDGNGYRDDDDFSDTDWLAEFKDTYRTPHQLIEILRDTAKTLAEGKIPTKSAAYWKDVIADCETWKIDDEYSEEI